MARDGNVEPVTPPVPSDTSRSSPEVTCRCVKSLSRGHWHEGHWVFGGTKRTSRRCFMIEVQDRRAQTLEPLIQRHILPGSHIISDGWASYANISNIAHGIYMHSVVNHSLNFVDPQDANIHTQNIENMWMLAKRKLKRQFGTSRELFPSYLQEFVFRNACDSETMFTKFLAALAVNYNI